MYNTPNWPRGWKSIARKFIVMPKIKSVMSLEFSGEVFHWRGPAPYLFVAVPEELSREIKSVSKEVTYGWGVIPVRAKIGKIAWTTSLFPKNGLYLVPIKALVQKAETVGVGDTINIHLEISF